MATAILRPNVDTTPNQWSITGCTLHHDCVDENITSPSGTGDGNSISANELKATDIEEFGLDNVPSDVRVITAIKMYALGYHGPAGGNVRLAYSIDGGSGWSSYKYPLLFPGPITPGWAETTSWTGLTITKAQGDAMLIELYAETGVKLYSIMIECIYVVITYTPAWATGNPIGVSNVNVGKILGVSKVDIGKFIGV